MEFSLTVNEVSYRLSAIFNDFSRVKIKYKIKLLQQELRQGSSVLDLF